jgi:hypothetical protein
MPSQQQDQTLPMPGGPMVQLSERLHTINNRVDEASQIFSEKFTHVDRKINAFNQLMEEDQHHKKELSQLRKQEISMLSEQTDKFFIEEKEKREEQEIEIS